MPPAHPAGQIALPQRLHLFGRGKIAVDRKDGAGLRVFGFFHALGVGDDAHHQLAQLFFGGEYGNDIAIAFGHLASVQPHQGFAVFGSQGLRQAETLLPIDEIEALGNINRHFHMLKLVISHRNVVRIEEQDVRRHQDRIGIEAHVYPVVRIPARFGIGLKHGFVGVGAVHQAFGGEGQQYGEQLKGLGHKRLLVKKNLFGVKPGSQPGRRDLQSHVAYRGWILAGVQRVVIRDKITCFAGFAKFQGGLDRSQIVAYVGNSSRFDAG